MKYWGVSMRKSMKWKIWAGVVLAAWPLGSALAQQTASVPAPAVMLSSLPAHSNEIVRIIDDPHNGARWYLLRDGGHPGGPGRMVLASEYEQNEKQRVSTATHFSPAAATELAPFHPCIRPGDHLIVEEHTPVMDAQLEAIAMAPAAVGGSLEVRLHLGGKVLRAVALGPGRATLSADVEVKHE
jgi:hypothetical protein